MIKARGGGLVVFGLSEENLTKLREGKPIRIKMADLGFDNDPRVILITYGRTEAALVDEFREFIGPDTDFRDEFDKRKP